MSIWKSLGGKLDAVEIDMKTATEDGDVEKILDAGLGCSVVAIDSHVAIDNILELKHLESS